MQYINSIWFVVLVACSHSTAQTSETLTPNDYEKKLSTTENKQVVDVRTLEEFGTGHLTDAVMIDYKKSDFKIQVSKLDRNKPVFVYCASGGRSASASEILVELGFKKVYDLKGGYRAWSAAGKPVIK